MGIGIDKSMSMGIGMGICKYNDGDRISTYALTLKVVILVNLRKVEKS